MRLLLTGLACALLMPATLARAQFDVSVEFLSIAADGTEVRESPLETGNVLWKTWRFMPVEVIAFRGDWRRIRDMERDEGWVHKSKLSSIQTVMVRTKEAKLRKRRRGKVEWILERGYPLRVFDRRGDWLEVSDLQAVSGWIHTSTVWGAVPRGR